MIKKSDELVLSPGQQVLLDVRMFTNSNKKLAEKWEGPYFVYQVHPKGVIDILKNNKIHRVNVDRLKPYVAPPPGFEHLGDQYQRPISEEEASEEEEEAVFFSQNPQMLQPGEQLEQPRRPRGRPRRGEGVPRVRLPYDGPTTRSMAQSCENQQQGQVQQISVQKSVKKISPTFIKYRDNAEVRDVIANCSYNFLMKAKPHLQGKRSQPTPTLYYGDGGACRDEYGIPVTKETLHHPSYLRRRQFFSSLSPSVRNSILTGDPELVFDPIFYEYILSFPQIPFVQDVAVHIDGPDDPPVPPFQPGGYPPVDQQPCNVGPYYDPGHPYPPDPMDIPLSSWDSSTFSDDPMDPRPPNDFPPPPEAGAAQAVIPQVPFRPSFQPALPARDPPVHPDWPHPYKGPSMDDILNTFDSSRSRDEYSFESQSSNRNSPAPSVHSFPSMSSSHASKVMDAYPSSHSNSSLSILNSSPSSSLREGAPPPPIMPTYAEITKTPIQSRPLPAIPVKKSSSINPSWGIPNAPQAVPSHAPPVGPPTRPLGAIPKQPTWKPKMPLPIKTETPSDPTAFVPKQEDLRPVHPPVVPKSENPAPKWEYSLPPQEQKIPTPPAPERPRSPKHRSSPPPRPKVESPKPESIKSCATCDSSSFPPPIPVQTPMEVLPTPMPRYKQLGWIPAPSGPSQPPVKRFQPSEFSVAPPQKKPPKAPASLPPSLKRSNSDPSQYQGSRVQSMPSVMTGTSDSVVIIDPLPMPEMPMQQLPSQDPFRSGRASTVQSPQDFYSTVSSDSMHSAMSEDNAISSNYASSNASQHSRSSLSSHSLSSSSSNSIDPFQRNDSRLSSRTVKEAHPDEMVAHPVIAEDTEEEEQEVQPPPFWSDDVSPPSFMPSDPSSLPSNVTQSYDNPIAVGEFEGAVVFSGRPIAPVLVPDQTGFREATGSGIPRPGVTPYHVDRSANLSSSSSSPSVHTRSSSDSNVLPLPPRAPASLRPATFIPSQQSQQQPQQRQQQQQSRLGQIARRLRGPKKE